MGNNWTSPQSVSRLRSPRFLLADALITASLLAWIACGSGSNAPLQPGVTVSVTPATASISIGRSQGLSASVANSTNTAVTWSVAEGSSGGSVTGAGVYTAPMVAGTYHVVATSQANPAATGSATITVTAPAPTFTSVAPAMATEGQSYSYTLTATDPVHTAIAFSLVTAPAGAQISGNVLTWTPTHAQSRASNAFHVRATTAAGGSASQEFSLTPRGTVHGTAIDSYTSSSGTVTVPQDLTTWYIAVAALVNGQWTTFQANTNSNGGFDIPGVPAGKYFLVTPAGAYWTVASDVDLGEDHLGRPDGLWPQAATSLTVDFTGLNAWKDDDYLWFVNPNLGQTFMWSAASADDQIATFNRTWTGRLSNAAKGDQWYVSQVATKEVGGSEFEYLRKAAPVLSVTQTDGSTVSLAGTMADITPASLALKILGSQFAAQTFSIHSDAQPHSTEIELDVQPFTATKGAIGPTPLLKSRDQDPILADLDYGTVGYGNPYPSTWTPVLNVEYEVNVSYTASGADSPVAAQGEIFLSTAQMPAAGSAVGPIIGPVQNIKLDGLALTQPRTAGSLMPTITWDAPLLGTPTVYQLTIYQLSNNGGESQYENVLDVYTSDRTLNLPDGTLASGSEYFFAIRAYYQPGVDLTTSPHRKAFPMAYADALTEIVSIPVSIGAEKLE